MRPVMVRKPFLQPFPTHLNGFFETFGACLSTTCDSSCVVSKKYILHVTQYAWHSRRWATRTDVFCQWWIYERFNRRAHNPVLHQTYLSTRIDKVDMIFFTSQVGVHGCPASKPTSTSAKDTIHAGSFESVGRKSEEGK